MKAENGTLVAELTVDKDHVNQFGTLHGGLSATLIDTCTFCAILTHEKGAGDYGSSVELHIKYFYRSCCDLLSKIEFLGIIKVPRSVIN